MKEAKEDKDQDVIRAAGGLLWRDSSKGKEIAVIHRKRYGGDWTLPKGKVKQDEKWQAAALREMKEETNYDAKIESFAGSVSYTVKGIPKVVLFWNMSPIGDRDFVQSDEVAELVWMPVEEALKKLDYEGERRLLADTYKLIRIGS